jgi:uncharacterized lipoprotein YajG
MKKLIPVLALLFVTACQVPRTSTVRERAELNTMLTTVQTALIVMQANKTLEPEEFALAIRQIAELREEVRQSETRAIGWADLALRVANMAAQWVAGVPAPEVPK